MQCPAVKQGVCQYQKVYKFLLKCFPCAVSFIFGSLKVSLSFVWYKTISMCYTFKKSQVLCPEEFKSKWLSVCDCKLLVVVLDYKSNQPDL